MRPACRCSDVVIAPEPDAGREAAILASWASDALAIASCPEGLKEPVGIDTILEALCELDGGPSHPPCGKSQCRLSTSRALAV